MCLIWGTTWLFIKIGLAYIPPLTGVGLRFVIAGAALFVVAALRRKIPPLRDWPWKLICVLAAFLFGLNYILTYTAETRIDSGLVAVLFGMTPFFTFAFGHFLAGERTTWQIWLGALVALAGVALISLGGQVQASPWYAVAAIGAAFSSAFANVYAKRHSHHDALTTLPPAMLLSGVVVFGIASVFERTDWHAALMPQSLGVLCYLALFGSGVAFFLNLWVLQRIPVWIVGLSALIIPVLAVAIGALAGGERFGIRELAGAVLVIAGITASLVQRGRSDFASESGVHDAASGDSF